MKQNTLICVDNLESPPRHAGPSKDQNLTSCKGKNDHKMNVRMFVSGGDGTADQNAQDMFKLLCKTGKFDDAIRDACNELGDESTTRGVVDLRIHKADEIPEMQQQRKDKRASANRVRSEEELCNDPLIAVTKREVCGDILFG